MSRRQLKPIYDLLETGNNKKVLVEVDKALAKTTSKQPQQQQQRSDDDPQLTVLLLKCLRSLALLRLNRREEFDKQFNEILDDSLNRYNNDENVLNLLMQACKESQEIKKVIRIYENALNCETTEELQTLLFYAYVRNRDYSKQLQLSIKLYKQTNKLIYLYWQGVTYYLQYLDNKEKNKLQLQLAQKIFDKIYSDGEQQSGKMDINGEFKFFIRFLIDNGQQTFALKLIQNLSKEDEFKIGELDFKQREEMNILEKMNNLSELHDKCEVYLKENNDEWSYLKIYVETNVKLALENDTKLNEDKINRLILFLDTLDSSFKGHHLAKLYLRELILENKYAFNNEAVNNLAVNFKTLIEKFSHKPGLVYDLMFFKHYPNDILDYFNKEGKLSIDQIYRLTNYYQFKLYSGKLNEDELDEITRYYSEGLKFGENILKTDQQYSDDLLLVKINYLFNKINAMSIKMNKYNDIVEQLLDSLYIGLKKSESNLQFKLYLMHIYSYLNAYDCIVKQYHSLEIKNIQYYSMSYHLLDNYCKSGQTIGTNELVSSDYPTSQNDDNLSLVERFFLNSKFEITNYLVNCYKYGTFTKLLELYDFLDKVGQSCSLNLCLSIICLRSLLFKTNESLTVDGLLQPLNKYLSDIAKTSRVFDEKSFNVDESKILDLSDYTCIELFNGEIQANSKEQINLIKQRNSLFVSIYFGLKLIDPGNLKNELLGKLNDAIDRFNGVSDDYLSQTLNFLKAQFENEALFQDSIQDQSSATFKEATLAFMSRTKTLCSQSESSLLTNTNKYSFNSSLIQLLSELNEKLAFISIIFFIIIKNQSTLWSEKFKKSKKKKDIYLNSRVTFELFYDSFIEIINLFNYLNDFTKTIVTSLASVDFGQHSDIKQSYLNSYKHLNEQFENKSKNLKQLINN